MREKEVINVLFDWSNWVCCCRQAKSHVFAMIKILAMTIRSVILLRDYILLLIPEKYKEMSRKWQLATLIYVSSRFMAVCWRFHIVWKLLKMSHLNFWIFHQFFPIKTDLSGSLFDRKLQVFKNSPKCTLFCIESKSTKSQKREVICNFKNILA